MSRSLTIFSAISLVLMLGGCESDAPIEDETRPAAAYDGFETARQPAAEPSTLARRAPVTGCDGCKKRKAQAVAFEREPEPIGYGAAEARRLAAEDALLVCAYNDPAKCEEYQVDGSISMVELARRLDDPARSPKILFYCACPEDASARRRAEEYLERGYDAGYVQGGFDALNR